MEKVNEAQAMTHCRSTDGSGERACNSVLPIEQPDANSKIVAAVESGDVRNGRGIEASLECTNQKPERDERIAATDESMRKGDGSPSELDPFVSLLEL